jgi:hypothetical protein
MPILYPYTGHENIHVFSILLLSGIAVTTITTTMQIQLAYSQATHCLTQGFGISRCVTPGQDPSATTCTPSGCEDRDLTHQQAGQDIGINHQACGQGFAECTVTP